ncbi:uncharacterized protein K452DRAFT_308885 [Aplosporella prunicola CBS 121167]|uniref:TAFII28-like protein domain-containing protein n=1 Tax=Aplosporella prunicola CBS 121167 TaxID=1176127 RepID=A0A6A6BCH3_9PEZI|nr:uncharacterized protein K452DRAFT_308885 [Aplosporella prunicola CBS 121167]KAF2141830.1 hypothetical protein K452DRAFT_308885 [Aplosporella prunicola CBS 121167]
MASPPSGVGLPKKRPSISGPLPTNPSKRRKPSTGPSGLRQTSFPPESSEQQRDYSRSPSVDSSFTTNTNQGKRRRGGGGGKGRFDDDVRSTTGTSVRGGKAGTAAGSEAPGDKGDDEPEEEEGGESLDAVMEAQGEADKTQDKEHMAWGVYKSMLTGRFSRDQGERYERYRAVKLKKETVRKITNQTLSQSVPQSVVTTINSYTKVFIGALIERARTVQQEWQAVAEHAPVDDPRLPANQAPPPPPQQQPQQQQQPTTPHPQYGHHNPYAQPYQHPSTLHPPYAQTPYSNIRISYAAAPPPPSASPSPIAASTPTGNSNTNINGASSTSQDTTTSTVPLSSPSSQPQSQSQSQSQPPTTNTNTTTTNDPATLPPTSTALPLSTSLPDRLAERDRGPLTPDHLREALRRYKKDREGGGMGFLGLSLEGRERTAGRMGGRRLFR